MKNITYIIVLLVFSETLHGQVQNLEFTHQLERDIFEQWQTDKSIKYGILDCLLIAEGHSAHLGLMRLWLDSLKKDVADQIEIDRPPLKKGRKLYEYIQARLLRKYSGIASGLSLMTTGEFSCVTATALYYELGNAISLPVIFHATPFHVCPVLQIEGKKVWIEMTNPKDGFDLDHDEKALVQWLLQNKFVLPEEIKEKGEDIVYNDFLKGHYQTSVNAILAYHYYNQALKQDGLGKTEDAYWDLAKAYTLENQDESITKVYDVSFLQISAISKLSSSYLNISKTYFQLRSADTSVSVQAIAAVQQGVQNVLEKDRNYPQIDSIVSFLEPVSHLSDIACKSYADLVQYVSVNKALEFHRTGKYKEAFKLISSEFDKDSHNAKLQDTYAAIGISYVQKSLSSGNSSVAVDIMDSLYKRLPDYADVRNIYVRVRMSMAMDLDSYKNNPAEAIQNLKKAYQIDSTNTYVRQAIARVYHELAMAEIRKSNWRAAQKYIKDGLKIVPEHEYLKSDLDLLKKEITKPKR